MKPSYQVQLLRFAARAALRLPLALLVATYLSVSLLPPNASAAVETTTNPQSNATTQRTATPEQAANSLESAAAKAGSTGRTIAMSLIGLALAVAAITLAFRRDFKEAAGVFAVGLVAVLLATPTGVELLKNTVSTLFGTH